MANNNKKFWNFKLLNENTGELYLYNEIASSSWWGDEVTPTKFKKDLDDLGGIETLNVYINSPGGDVFAGVAISNMLKRHSSTVNIYVDGYAASIASVIAMAGDTIFMYSGSMLMVHNPWTGMYGNAEDFRKRAEDLDNVRTSLIECYMERATDVLTEEKLIELLNGETWLGSKESQKYFNNIELLKDTKQLVASAKDMSILNQYKNMPNSIILQDEVQITEVEKTLKATVQTLTENNEAITNQLNDVTSKFDEATETIITLSKKVEDLKVIENVYQEDLKNKASEKRIEDIQNLSDTYEAKFKKVNGLDTFNSEEVQNLIVNIVDDKEKDKSISTLNSMIIDLIPEIKDDKNSKKVIKEVVNKSVSNLIPKDKSFESRYCE